MGVPPLLSEHPTEAAVSLFSLLLSAHRPREPESLAPSGVEVVRSGHRRTPLADPEPTMLTVRSTLRWLAAGCHRIAGMGWYHCGRYERSQRHFQRVLELRGDDFAAYVYLGRLAYSLGDYAGWRRECEHARRTSPERFARLKHPFELHESRTDSPVFEEAGERASWRMFRVSQVGTTPPTEARRALPGFAAPPLPSDDCSSAEERRRFHGLGPLMRAEIESVDLDELARKLVS